MDQDRADRWADDRAETRGGRGHPRLFARRSGALASATYACTTPMVPPQSCTIREMSKSQSVLAYARKSRLGGNRGDECR
jgi:hypothetical protein